MRGFYFQCLLLALVFSASAQTSNQVVLGHIDSMTSKALNEQRKIWVYIPQEDGNGAFTKEKYPVVYLLDGDSHFYSVVGMIHQLSSVNGNTVCPKMIVVGIPNTERTRDLTPTHVTADPPFMDSASSSHSGGGERFMSFIENELIPHIDSLYPTAPYRLLIGHSFGGLSAINALIHHTRLFNAYIVIDPSMWWDHQKLLQEVKTDLAKRRFDGISLYLGIANTMQKGMDTSAVRKDTASLSKHIRSILSLNDNFRASPDNGLRFNSKYYDSDDHGSVPLITEYDGLRFIFDYYRMSLSLADYFDPNKRVDTLLENHYLTVSRKLGYEVKPTEEFMNNMGYMFMGLKQYDKAESIFRMNIAYYPGSSNVYDSMGDLYVAKSNKQKAIENYKKALSVREVPETRSKLEKLLR